MNPAEFSWSEFLHMGGYAFFVWWSYGITFAVLLALVVSSLTGRRSVIARVKRAIKRENI